MAKKIETWDEEIVEGPDGMYLLPNNKSPVSHRAFSVPILDYTAKDQVDPLNTGKRDPLYYQHGEKSILVKIRFFLSVLDDVGALESNGGGFTKVKLPDGRFMYV